MSVAGSVQGGHDDREATTSSVFIKAADAAQAKLGLVKDLKTASKAYAKALKLVSKLRVPVSKKVASDSTVAPVLESMQAATEAVASLDGAVSVVIKNVDETVKPLEGHIKALDKACRAAEKRAASDAVKKSKAAAAAAQQAAKDAVKQVEAAAKLASESKAAKQTKKSKKKAVAADAMAPEVDDLELSVPQETKASKPPTAPKKSGKAKQAGGGKKRGRAAPLDGGAAAPADKGAQVNAADEAEASPPKAPRVSRSAQLHNINITYSATVDLTLITSKMKTCELLNDDRLQDASGWYAEWRTIKPVTQKRAASIRDTLVKAFNKCGGEVLDTEVVAYVPSASSDDDDALDVFGEY